jgi:Protein of unknown function (DUF4058)
MPSPFPGMDPYLEMVEWQDFHLAFMTAIRRQLTPLIEPKYLARLERRIFVESHFDEKRDFYPDLEIIPSPADENGGLRGHGMVATLEPKLYAVPLPEEHRETYLVIKDLENRHVVTVIEVLSPTNKATGSDGARIYNEKREELLSGKAHLMEIDLLRKGRRPVTRAPIPDSTDYCVFLHRTRRRSKVEVYEWTVRDPLPTVPVPLADGDPDAMINLQAAFTEVYQDARYDLELPYNRALSPTPRRKDAAWLKTTLSRWRTKRRRK